MKRRWISTESNGVTTQKILYFTAKVVRTSHQITILYWSKTGRYQHISNYMKQMHSAEEGSY
jgi:hypothetical protein